MVARGVRAALRRVPQCSTRRRGGGLDVHLGWPVRPGTNGSSKRPGENEWAGHSPSPSHTVSGIAPPPSRSPNRGSLACSYPVTYINLDDQISAEREWQRWIHKESYARRTLIAVHGGQLLSLLQKFEQQRLTLGGLAKGHRVEVHYRLGMEYYEGMAWEHLMSYLVLARERVHGLPLKGQQT